MKTTALFTALTTTVCGPVIALALLTTLLTGANPTTTNCAPSPPAVSQVTGLSSEQLERAALIHAAALETGLGVQAAIVGIATALQESDLGADPTSRRPNADGDIGLFQMRTLIGWHANGDNAEENITTLLDDRYQSRVFFLGHTTRNGGHIPGLVDIPGWRHLSITHAAQHVQQSALPHAYAKHETTARTIVALSHTAKAVIPCQAVPSECPATPEEVGSEHGLTPDARRVMRCVAARWPRIRSIGGLRPGDPKDHGTGRAVDIMIPDWTSTTGAALGDQIAEWARTNADTLGVTYVIWQRHIWSLARTREGWRNCSHGSCYNGPDPTAAHEDHVHISVSGTTNTHQRNGSHPAVVLPISQGGYRITARFGDTGTRWATTHTGLDFAAPTGTSIRAVTAGTVTYAQPSGGPYGNLTKTTASDGTETWYAHQQRISVRVGETVAAGQDIGAVGDTGNVTGPHLHLELRSNGLPINPLTWLRTNSLDP